MKSKFLSVSRFPDLLFHLPRPYPIFPPSLWSEQMCAFHLCTNPLPPIFCRSCTIYYFLSPESLPSPSLLFSSTLSKYMNKNLFSDLMTTTSYCSLFHHSITLECVVCVYSLPHFHENLALVSTIQMIS